MIDGRGETPLRLRLTDVEEAGEPVLEFETTVNFLDPTEEVEMAFRLADLIFPEPGDYRLQLYAVGKFLRERRLLVSPWRILVYLEWGTLMRGRHEAK